MIVKAATPAPPTNHQAIQNSAESARAEALALFSTAKIDNAAVPAPIEQGDVEPKEVPVVEAKDPDEGAPEDGEPKEEAKVEEKPAPKKEEGLADPLKKSFEKLAQEKADLRKEKDALKVDAAKMQRFSQLEEMASRGDALGILAAHGLGYSHAVKQLTGGKDPGETVAAEEEAPSSAVEALRAEVAELKADRKRERFERGEEKLIGEMGEIARGLAAKLPNVSADPELISRARDYLYEYIKKAGSPPGETRSESIQMALEAVEESEAKTAEKYRKRLDLTPAAKSADTAGEGTKSAVDQPASELGSSRKTLTNSHASTPKAAGQTRPKTVAELHAEALKLFEAQG